MEFQVFLIITAGFFIGILIAILRALILVIKDLKGIFKEEEG